MALAHHESTGCLDDHDLCFLSRWQDGQTAANVRRKLRESLFPLLLVVLLGLGDNFLPVLGIPLRLALALLILVPLPVSG